MGLGVGSQVERGFSWERKGPLKARVMALRLKAHTAEAAMLFLHRATGGGRVRGRDRSHASGDVASDSSVHTGQEVGDDAALGRFLCKRY